MWKWKHPFRTLSTKYIQFNWHWVWQKEVKMNVMFATHFNGYKGWPLWTGLSVSGSTNAFMWICHCAFIWVSSYERCRIQATWKSLCHNSQEREITINWDRRSPVILIWIWIEHIYFVSKNTVRIKKRHKNITILIWTWFDNSKDRQKA